MSEQTVAIAGQLDVDDVLALVVHDDAAPAPAVAVRGELVAPADELVDAFVATLVARPRPSAPTSARAGASSAGWAPSPPRPT